MPKSLSEGGFRGALARPPYRRRLPLPGRKCFDCFQSILYISMDSNKKGKSWVGNICHQFETICQDVDNFMNKETVKYVENQVHNVGVSVKRFYSDVVQDVLPPTEENVKLQQRSATAEQVVTGDDHMDSVTSIKAMPVRVAKDERVMEHGYFDTLRDSNASTPSKYCETQITKLPFTYPSQKMITDSPSREGVDATTWKDEDNALEDNVTWDLIPATDHTNSSEKISGTCDHKNHMLPMAASPALLISDAEFSAIRKKMIDGFPDDKEFLSNISTVGWFLEGDLPRVTSPNSIEIKSLCAPIVASADKAHEKDTLAMDSLLSSGCDVGYKALNEDGTLCDIFPTEDASLDVLSTVQSTELVFSNFPCDNEEAAQGVVSSTSSASPKTSNIVEFLTESFIQKDEDICSDVDEPNRSTCTNFTPSSRTTDYETKTNDMLPFMGSTDLNSSATESSSINGSFQSRHENCHEDAQSALSLSQSGSLVEFGVGDTDHDMETVDLSSNVKHDTRNLVLNCNFSHSLSHRRRNFRYYKDLIQDAFASRKRLSKEYEHLGIWYGDIDMESRQNFELSSSCSSPKSANVARTRSLDMCESDWELL